MRPLLACILAIATAWAAEPATAAPAAAPAPVAGNWYRIQVENAWDEKSGTYYGSSPLGLNALVTLMSDRKPIRLDNLVVVEVGEQTVSWHDLDPVIKGTVVIAADKIVTIMPLTGDPRQVAVEESPKSEPADPGKM